MQLGHYLGIAQQPQEGFLAEIGGIPLTAQPPTQPGLQPTAVVAVERLEGARGLESHITHAGCYLMMPR